MPADRPFAEPGTPLRWTRPRQVELEHLDLAITAAPPQPGVGGTATARVRLLAGAKAERGVRFDQQDLRIHAVRVDGADAAFSVTPGEVRVAVDSNLERVTIAIDFTADHPAKGWLAVEPGPGRVAMSWTQGAMEDHHHWFPCIDTPNQICTQQVSIRHPSALVGLAGGEQVGRTDHGDGWTTTVWAMRKPQVLYLLNVVVGDLEGVTQDGPVPITHWLPRGHADAALAMFRATPFAVRWLSDFTGTPFPWPCYRHAVVHRFPWGGMENTTLTNITDRALMTAADQQRDGVDVDALVVHELVHQWFGNLVTMKAWSDIWLNESFATYLEARGTAAWRAATEGCAEADELDRHLWADRMSYLDEDGSRYRRALVTNRYGDAYELFDRVSYEKGGIILHHLRCLLGEERFRAAIALYLKRHAHGLVETNDWLQAVEDATGEPLDWFAHQWLHRAGHPELKVTYAHDPARGRLLVTVEQTQAAKDAEQVYRLPCRIAFGGDRVDGSQEVVLDAAHQVIVIPAAQAPAWVCVDADGHLPATWEEGGDAAACLARLRCAGLGAQARARAAVAAGKRHPTPALISGLATLVMDATQPELVRQECCNALGSLRHRDAATALLEAIPNLPQRLRRVAASNIGKLRGDAVVADRLMALADVEPSPVTVGELLAARGACEVAGATPQLRARLAKPSWQQRLRAGALRGLGVSGEIAAIDDCLPLVLKADELDAVRCAAANAAARLAAQHPLARPRVRQVLERALEDTSLAVRSTAASALETLGDPDGLGALASRHGREPFGNVQRAIREAQRGLRETAAEHSTLADARKRIDELEAAKGTLERRLEALEKRLG